MAREKKKINVCMFACQMCVQQKTENKGYQLVDLTQSNIARKSDSTSLAFSSLSKEQDRV